ncbi:hypothetical protein [uncultured Parvibaculum sp.]|tara:strand:- start:154041 stop:154178 length:138 start_codon:yes stop_codon:yes gene_type:complete
MRGLWNRTVDSEAGGWLQDVAALVSVTAFIWAAGAWVGIAEALVG